jgi:hypothetical protein
MNNLDEDLQYAFDKLGAAMRGKGTESIIGEKY